MKAIPCLLSLLFAMTAPHAQVNLKDKFGRDLNGQRIVLVDWEGYMANPAIQLTLQASTGASFPLTVTVSANHPRLYFDLPSDVGASGPTKTITLTNTNPIDFYLSIFPDRDGANESYTLSLQSSAGTQNFPISVIDQDAASPSIDFKIALDYSEDIAYNFFASQSYRDVVRQVADDWAFFVQNMNFDSVVTHDEFNFIWNDEFNSGRWVTNQNGYRGFLLYVYGIHVSPHRSGGGPSLHAFQKVGGVSTQLRRSGGYLADIHGNYNTLGWNAAITDDTWYLATNGGNVPNDLYSIALHEMGHALCFNPGYPVFGNFKSGGFVTNPEVVSYHGSPVPIDGADHLSNGAPDVSLMLVDRLSKKGAFGSEYAGVIPWGRWLITKLNLLCLKAIGYSIKQTSCFSAPAIHTPSLPAGATGQNYQVALQTVGGIPFYKFEIISGDLPAGLSLNSFTGSISGLPSVAGNFAFTVRLTDYDNQFAEKTLSLLIADVYRFVGNGDWNNPSNWTGNRIPAVPLPSGAEVIIDPVAGGECTYVGNLTLQTGAKLTVQPGKVLNVKSQ